VKDKVVLTHSPDRITSEWMLCHADKSFKVMGGRIFEIVDKKLYPMNADVYHRDNERFYAGYRNKKGRYTVYEKNGLLTLSRDGEDDKGSPLYNVDLYEDISGKYFPILEKKSIFYRKRNDGKVELVEFDDKGSRGKVVENLRDKLSGEDGTLKEHLEEEAPEYHARDISR
jgi:hypothetical protein